MSDMQNVGLEGIYERVNVGNLSDLVKRTVEDISEDELECG